MLTVTANSVSVLFAGARRAVPASGKPAAPRGLRTGQPDERACESARPSRTRRAPGARGAAAPPPDHLGGEAASFQAAASWWETGTRSAGQPEHLEK